MAQILISRWGDPLLNRGQLRAVLQEANRVYNEDPWSLSGHGVSHLMPLDIAKLEAFYEIEHCKLYLDGWLGVALPQVCLIARPIVLEDNETYYGISMDDGWVDFIKDRTISVICYLLDRLEPSVP